MKISWFKKYASAVHCLSAHTLIRATQVKALWLLKNMVDTRDTLFSRGNCDIYSTEMLLYNWNNWKDAFLFQPTSLIVPRIHKLLMRCFALAEIN